MIFIIAKEMKVSKVLYLTFFVSDLALSIYLLFSQSELVQAKNLLYLSSSSPFCWFVDERHSLSLSLLSTPCIFLTFLLLLLLMLFSIFLSRALSLSLVHQTHTYACTQRRLYLLTLVFSSSVDVIRACDQQDHCRLRLVSLFSIGFLFFFLSSFLCVRVTWEIKFVKIEFIQQWDDKTNPKCLYVIFRFPDQRTGAQSSRKIH